jgi:hypothetical protein
MTTARLSLGFSIEPDCTFDTIEMVLATARRTGTRLARLDVRAYEVLLQLDAGDEDLLMLFRARLHNVIGVHSIAERVCMLPKMKKYRTLHPLSLTGHETPPCRCRPACSPPVPPLP